MVLAAGRYVNIGGTAVDLGGGGGGSLVDIGHSLPWPAIAGSQGGGAMSITGTTIRGGWVIRMPAAGTIDTIRWRTAAVTSAADVRVRLETVSGGFPTGTLVAAGAEGSVASAALASATTYETTIGTPPTMAAGDLVAVVFDSPTGSPNWSQVNSASTDFVSGQLTNIPKMATYNGTSWSKLSGIPIGGVKVSGAYLAGLTVVDQFATTSFNSGSTPDERGIVVAMPFTCRAVGLYMASIIADADPMDLVLYDDADTVLGTCTVSGGKYANTTAWPFDSGAGIQMDAGATYRVTCKPTSGSSINILSVNPGTAALAAIMGGNGAKHTERTNAGAWTDTDYKRTLVGIVFDQVIAA